MNSRRLSAFAALGCTLVLLSGCKKKAPEPITITPQTQVVPHSFLGTWPAANLPTEGVAGDVTIGSTTMRIGDHVVVVENATSLGAPETAALAGFNTVQGTPIAAFLAKVPIPANTQMLGGNILCGGRETTWMAGILGSGAQLGLVVFSGAQAPVLTVDALKSTHDVCASFSFAK